jgi:hypothetical protein
MPDPAFANQLLERLVDDLADARTSAHDAAGPADQAKELPVNPEIAVRLPLPWGLPRETVERPSRSQWRSRRSYPQLIAAALLVFLIGAGALISGQLQRGPEEPRAIPAAVWQEDQDGLSGPTAETLFAASIDPDDISAAGQQLEWNKALLSYMEIEPGVTYNTDHPAFFCCHGLAVYQIIDGRLTIETDGPVQIFRAGATSPESAGFGVPVELHTGDTAITEMSEPPADITNASSAMTFYLAGYVYKLDSPEPPGACCWPEGYQDAELAWAQTFTPSVETAGPVSLSLEKIVFAPGATFEFDSASSQVLLGAVPSGRLQTRFLNADGSEEDIFMMDRIGPTVFDMVSLFAGTAVRFINSTDEPVTLYLFRFDPPRATEFPPGSWGQG